MARQFDEIGELRPPVGGEGLATVEHTATEERTASTSLGKATGSLLMSRTLRTCLTLSGPPTLMIGSTLRISSSANNFTIAGDAPASWRLSLSKKPSPPVGRRRNPAQVRPNSPAIHTGSPGVSSDPHRRDPPRSAAGQPPRRRSCLPRECPDLNLGHGRPSPLNSLLACLIERRRIGHAGRLGFGHRVVDLQNQPVVST